MAKKSERKKKASKSEAPARRAKTKPKVSRSAELPPAAADPIAMPEVLEEAEPVAIPEVMADDSDDEVLPGYSGLAAEEDEEPEVLAEEVMPEEAGSMVPAKPETIARLNALQRYLAEVRNYSLLTREEEQELALRYRERDDLDAARRLVTSNLRLVVKIALDYYRQWMDLLDLVQEGNLGLMQAVKKFDPYRGLRLSTYASFWIRAYILKFLMDNWRLVKIGTTQAQRKLFFNLRKEKDRLEQSGFKAAPQALAAALDVKESEVVEMDQRLSSRDESLDQPVSEDGKQTREMTIPDERQAVDDRLAEHEFARIVRRKLRAFRESLNDPDKNKEAFIFDRRLMAETPLTLQKVGEHFDISRERVRQLEARLVKNLRAYLKDQLPDFEDYDFILR